MSVTHHDIAIAVFDRDEDARRALDALERAGFTQDQLGYAFHDRGRTGEAGGTLEPGDTKIGQGAAGGAVTGGVVGGLIGAAAAGLIPGVGPIIAAGALTSVLGGAAAGAAVGGLFGAVVGLGVTDEEARFYEQEFNRGGSLVAVRADDRYNEAIDILARNGGRFADDRTANRAPAGRQADEPVSEPRRGEEETDPMTRGETLTPREGRAIGDRSQTFTPSGGGGHERGERVSVAGQYPSDPPEFRQRDWDEARHEFRGDYERRFAAGGRAWEDVEPGYRYGYEMAQDPRYRGRRWEEVEPELRAGFDAWYASQRYTRATDDRAATVWEGIEDNVRDAWNRLTGSDVARDDEPRAGDTSGRPRNVSDDWRAENP